LNERGAAVSNTPSTPTVTPALPGAASDSYVRTARAFLVLGFGLVLIIGVCAVLTAIYTTSVDRLVSHSFEVQQVAGELLSDLQGAETGQRGFLLTGQDSYLEPYNRALTSVPHAFDSLRTLTADNPDQYERLTALKSLIDAKFDELRTTVNLTQQGQRAQALALVNTNLGKNIMDDIRARLTAILQTESDLLTSREASAASLRRWMLALIIISLAAALFLAGFFARSTQYYVGRLKERTVQLESESRHRHEAEKTLRQSQKNEAIGQLTGGISHDFNNLLTVIIGSFDTIQRGLAEATRIQDANQLAAMLRKPLAMGVQGARNAAQLTHRLLAFSRGQALEPRRLDLNRLISDMSDMLRRTLGETIEVETVLAGGLWTTFVDVGQLENALVNLCVNARDAMPNGGHLTIETANTFLDDAYTQRFGDVTPGQYALLSVTDTGTGIPEGVFERVFEPFFTTKPMGEGSGLGLAMVHGFVKQSGGHIRIYSELDQGTTVKIYLPRLIQPEQAAAAPAAKAVSTLPAPLARASETVLLVEDNDTVREYAKDVLEELGYRVLEARDASEALRLFDGATRVDVLFTDVVLPGGMNGRELADKILALRGGIPVLFTTGYTRNAIVHGGRLDADVNLLSKPYTHRDLAWKIRELIDGKPTK
jgi:signal transduction histidine kinase/CheY-like chemotaxis protein